MPTHSFKPKTKMSEASELNSKKTSETIDTLKFKVTESPTEKTVEKLNQNKEDEQQDCKIERS